MIHVKKRIIFHFYIPQDWEASPVVNLHLKCLENYAGIFDEAEFTIIPDDINDIDSVKKIEKRLLSIFKNTPIEFRVAENSYLREAETFYNRVALRLGELDGITFFGHSKGITNVATYDKNSIYRWITAMYYGCLNDMPAVEDRLTNKRQIGYGSLLNVLKNIPENIREGVLFDNGKYLYAYVGTFFWINTGTLKDYLDKTGSRIPELTDRWYAENFLSNLVTSQFCACNNNAYSIDYYGGWAYIDNLIDTVFVGDDNTRYREFHNRITKGIE